jgi:hypothetical protein
VRLEEVVARVGASESSEGVGQRWGRPEAWVPRRRLPWRTVASSTQGCGSASVGNTDPFIGAAASLCAPTAAETCTGSKTSAGALGRGRARTDRWIPGCVAGDERGSST